MNEDQGLSRDAMQEVRRGLRMARPPDPARLEEERRLLESVETRGLAARSRVYFKLIGPGYLQSAMTLGGGTAAASLFAGAAFGYRLLWVAPVAMLMGIIMLAAVSHQTLSTGLRPFEAMRRYAGAPLAWGWALGALVSSIIWHFPQYSLAAAVVVDLGEVAGLESLPPQGMSFLVCGLAVGLSFLYGTSDRLVRWYERILKYMVWGIVVCFGLVVVKTGIPDWGALGRGFFSFEIPEDRGEILGATVILSGLSAAVGINMVFLYPYSLLARGWGREHRRMARFDLLVGMFLPYVLATSLMVIATANVIHPFEGTRIAPIEAARSLSEVVGPVTGRVIFNFGVLGMALSSISLQMLTAGFVGTELFGWEVGSLRYRLATLMPVPGVLGPVLWSEHLLWLAVPTNILCGLLLPIAYAGFVLLQRNKAYLGNDRPRGTFGHLWWSAMLAVTLLLTVSLGWYLFTRVF